MERKTFPPPQQCSFSSETSRSLAQTTFARPAGVAGSGEATEKGGITCNHVYGVMAKKNFRENSNMPDNTPKQQAKLAKKFDRDRKNLQKLMDTHQKLQIKHAKSNLRALQNKQKEQVTFLDASIKECRDRFVQDWTAHKQSHREEETFFQKKKQDILKQMKAPKKEKKKVKKHQQKQKQQQDQKKKTEKKDFVVVHAGANDGSYWKQVPLSQPVAFGPDWTHERWYS